MTADVSHADRHDEGSSRFLNFANALKNVSSFCVNTPMHLLIK